MVNMFKVPNQYRVKEGFMGSDDSYGNCGLFIFFQDVFQVSCIASDGEGWEHVSVSVAKAECPDWNLMCIVKDLFWDAEDCVVQYHPPKSQYVNCHKYVLHLWRKTGFDFPVPDPILVGPKS